jgi:hypothetical protein
MLSPGRIVLALLALLVGVSFPALFSPAMADGSRAVAPSRSLPGALPREAIGADRATQARACLAAAAAAEAALGLPRGLLEAVSLIESSAHPFAIGTPERAHYPSSAADAARLARNAGAGASGGCFQINLAVHAPRDTAWVFDPWASALFAGRLLARLGSDGHWGEAIALYAGARPDSEPGRMQRCRVAATLAGLGKPAPFGLDMGACRIGEARTAQGKARSIAALAGRPITIALDR